MLQQFKSMNELVEYLGRLEERVKILEEENQNLRVAEAPTPALANNVDERTIAKMVASFLPMTNIIHPNFLKRAFAVWGHYFVAQLIITIPLLLIEFCIFLIALSNRGTTP